MAKILLVDDYFETREIYTKLLTQAGHTVIQESDGKSAYQKILDESFDLILLDIYLPQMGAVEILKNLKQNQIGVKYIVVMSVIGQENLVKDALSNGAVGNVVKSSLSHTEVVNNILSYLKKTI